MSAFMELLSQPLTERLGWALVHFLWQGALVAGLLVGLLRILRAASAEARYLADCVALVVMAGLAPRRTTSRLIPLSHHAHRVAGGLCDLNGKED